MARPYPREFRDDVVRVARNREDGVTIEHVAADFGIHSMTLSKWLRQCAIDTGHRSGKSTTATASRVGVPAGWWWRRSHGVPSPWSNRKTIEQTTLILGSTDQAWAYRMCSQLVVAGALNLILDLPIRLDSDHHQVGRRFRRQGVWSCFDSVEHRA